MGWVGRWGGGRSPGVTSMPICHACPNGVNLEFRWHASGVRSAPVPSLRALWFTPAAQLSE